MVQRALRRQDVVCLVHTGVLIALVTGASYAGTSNLFAAYLAGASISWWDSELPHTKHASHASVTNACPVNGKILGESPQSSKGGHPSPEGHNPAKFSQTQSEETDSKDLSGTAVYEAYYKQPVERILKPFFFIGRLPMPHSRKTGYAPQEKESSAPITAASSEEQEQTSSEPRRSEIGLASTSNLEPVDKEADRRDDSGPDAEPSSRVSQPSDSTPTSHLSKDPKKPLSLYPASILGCAMVSRGEIGFLISSVAQSNGIFDSAAGGNEDDDAISIIFLVVTWGIFLCTIIGPLTVGLLVRRVKRLSEKSRSVGARDALGVWGVE
ncbi:hypothetical protein LTS18_010367 [Coniosporium uncinatum]|uniref:Uncharacterized protein n=1 Tax=Coniosporium uncinatum TaxID=93489 RepID=A0ACC3CZT8_9PEZI|nr:hypothetical protein LTS18_010367 [Coniosporium uncinatum]